MNEQHAVRLLQLQSAGTIFPDPRQVYIAPDVLLERIHPGSILYPGTRLQGDRTFVGARARIGPEGPAVLQDAVFANDTEIGSGYANGAVLLPGAKLGANAHARPGTILEEGASTAHSVGLKQTILMAFVTVGSLINFCDALMSGGSSGRDHSEIGSGFIHFNFTPFGEHGDKATPSLIGDVVHGAFLREERIFLGGLSGLVGPQQVGFGAVTIAGQVIRKRVAPGHLFGSTGVELDKPFSKHRQSAPTDKVTKNFDYIRELFALRSWYSAVRLARTPQTYQHLGQRLVLTEAIATIDTCIDERTTRLNDLLDGFGQSSVSFKSDPPACPLSLTSPELNHIDWVRSLDETAVAQGQEWLAEVAETVTVTELPS